MLLKTLIRPLNATSSLLSIERPRDHSRQPSSFAVGVCGAVAGAAGRSEGGEPGGAAGRPAGGGVPAGDCDHGSAAAAPARAAAAGRLHRAATPRPHHPLLRSRCTDTACRSISHTALATTAKPGQAAFWPHMLHCSTREFLQTLLCMIHTVLLGCRQDVCS
jgi:hypothetical protein